MLPLQHARQLEDALGRVRARREPHARVTDLHAGRQQLHSALGDLADHERQQEERAQQHAQRRHELHRPLEQHERELPAAERDLREAHVEPQQAAVGRRHRKNVHGAVFGRLLGYA